VKVISQQNAEINANKAGFIRVVYAYDARDIAQRFNISYK